MNVLDLFSGIGGFSLGLERAGMRTVAFCEIDPFCQRVLRKHWPRVPIYDDVRTLTAARLRANVFWVDVICGGFPCQDISTAGKGAGIEGERSGLWTEYARIIGEVGPRYVIVENVAALLGRGLDVVLRDLAALGFDAEWHCIPASAIGAPHRRDRIWIVANSRHRVESERPRQTRRPTEQRASIGPVPERHGEHGLWPTPDASVAQYGETPETWLPRRERLKKTANNGNGCGTPLAMAVQLWPTPNAGDYKAGMSNAPGRQQSSLPRSVGIAEGVSSGRRGGLNPTWVEWLMGFPIKWTDCPLSATPSSRKSRKSSVARS